MTQGFENFDGFRQAQNIIRKEGLILEDEKGRKYLHPAAIWEKTCKNNFQRLMRQIGFVEGIKKAKRGPGRPPGEEFLKYGNVENTES